MSSTNELIQELGSLPDRVAALIAGRSEDELRRRPGPDQWSAKEIVCHLRDATRIDHERLFLAATHDHPFLAAYDEAALARDSDYQNAVTSAIVPVLRSWRDETVYLLSNLPPNAWQSMAVHEEIGEVSVTELVNRMVEHEAGHLRDLHRLLG